MNSFYKLPKVLYLSSTNKGEKLLKWLETLPCDIVFKEINDVKLTKFPLTYDLGISFLYTHKIPPSELERTHRWINFHPGPLPEFRGRNLAYHAIASKSDHFGATIHYMDKEFDTGNIIEVVRFSILTWHTAGDLVKIAHATLEQLFKKHVPRLIKGTVDSYPQSIGNYYRRGEINEIITLTEEQETTIRAVTVAPKYYARVVIGGKEYKIIPSDEA